MSELTITGKTTLVDVRKFAEGVDEEHQIRAKTNRSGQTVLYSKDPNACCIGFKSSKQYAQLAKNTIQKLVDKEMGETNTGVLLQDLVKSHPTMPNQVFLEGSDLQRILGKASTIESMVESREEVPIDNRKQIMVAMAQGAIGRMDQFQFYSDSFSSCMPVILYNRQTGIGGLFHVPSPRVDEDNNNSLSYREGVRDALAEMISLVKPTDIIVKPGGTAKTEQESDRKFSGALAVERAEYVAKDMELIARSLELGTKVDFQRDAPSTTIVVTGGEKGLLVQDTDIQNGSEVDLFKSDLPPRLSDQVLTWSLAKQSDRSVLVEGSKFL